MIRLTNPLEVRRYIAHPEIFDAIADDGVLFENYIPTMREDDHFIVTAPESMFYLHPFSSGVWQIHAHVHPDFRENALPAAREALGYAFNQLSALKVVCLVPEIFPRVRGFAVKCGLRDEGFISDSYVKKNTLHGQYLLGISRAEYEGQ